MSKRKISVQEIVEIVTNADDSDLSKLFKEEECNNNAYEVAPSKNEQSDAVESNGGDSTDEDDNLPFCCPLSLETKSMFTDDKNVITTRKSPVYWACCE